MDETVISEDVRQFLVNMPIFGRLHDEELTIVQQYLQLREVPAGTTLFEQGDDGQFVCFIIHGRVVVERTVAGGGGFRIELGRQQSFGEMSLIDSLPRSARVRSLAHTRFLMLTRPEFERLVADHPPIGVRIVSAIARLLSLKLRDTSDRYGAALDPSVGLALT